MRWKVCLAAFLLISLLRTTPAVDWYVATNGTGLGTNGWANATNNLQGAIDKSAASDTIWVSNGIYASGGVTNYPAGSILTNRIAITKAITVRSKDNNPTNTIIRGAWASDGNTNGPNAVRCVYMAANSSLIGFTITNGATLSVESLSGCGGGVYCPAITTPVISNCIITGNSAYGGLAGNYGGGGVWYGTLHNCSLIGNMTYGAPALNATHGGGAAYSIMVNCTLTGNLGKYGGGGRGCVLSNCTLTANTARAGGGAYGGTLYNCSVISNQATENYGGGVHSCILYNCTLTGNRASDSMAGGGAYDSTLYNCLLTGNHAGYGGGAGSSAASKLYNCTLVGNKATGGTGGGGVYGGTLSNCIVYFNSGGASISNWTGCTFVNSCTAPAAAGAGNITDDPMLLDKGSDYGTNHVAGNYRLSGRSPCVNAGTNLSWMRDGSVTSRDLDGRARIRYGTVDMGAYENIRAGTIYGVR